MNREGEVKGRYIGGGGGEKNGEKDIEAKIEIIEEKEGR